MQLLGVQHSSDGGLTALVEIDHNHCSTCFADGVQVITGCTFGKGNIRSLGYGKFALTLIDKKTKRSVRVVATKEAMRRSQESEFIKERKAGVAPSKIDPSLVDPLIDQVLSEDVKVLFNFGPIQHVDIPPMLPHAFDTFICSECGEVTVERYARVKNGQLVCIPCSEKFS